MTRVGVCVCVCNLYESFLIVRLRELCGNDSLPKIFSLVWCGYMKSVNNEIYPLLTVRFFFRLVDFVRYV